MNKNHFGLKRQSAQINKKVKNKIKEREKKNYKNFGFALLAMLGVMLVLAVFGYYFFQGFVIGMKDSGRDVSIAYKSGRFMGALIGEFLFFYIKNGLFMGNILAVIASREKGSSFLKIVLHGLLGWLYVIYYALTRKTVKKEEYML